MNTDPEPSSTGLPTSPATAPSPYPTEVAAVPAQAGAVGHLDVGPSGKDRSPAAVLGLSIVTLGIYYLVWYGMINGEIRRHDPDIKVRPGLSVLALVIPIANLISAYSTAARIRQMQLDDGAQQTISPVVALLLVIFLGIGYPLYVSSQLREHWHGHRRQARLGEAGPRNP